MRGATRPSPPTRRRRPSSSPIRLRPTGSGYGSGTALSGPIALVGAPFEGDGTVRVFTLADDNSATQTGTLTRRRPERLRRRGRDGRRDDRGRRPGAGGGEAGSDEAVNIYDPVTLALIKTLLGCDSDRTGHGLRRRGGGGRRLARRRRPRRGRRGRRRRVHLLPHGRRLGRRPLPVPVRARRSASAARSRSRTARSSSAHPSRSTRTRGSYYGAEAGAAHLFGLTAGSGTSSARP